MTTPLIDFLPDDDDADSLLVAFIDACEQRGLELYRAQEEAVLELFAGNNVILNTPTGSGKSLVALAVHFAAVARRERSWYTAPIKALVSEKFFELCADLGPDNVGMVTGDATVNADAPVICATSEILANLALREGSSAAVDHVVMDEFHFYADVDRGWSWQVPLLELRDARFLLMSATLGDTSFFVRDLTARTGRETKLVAGVERPVPLDFQYRTTPVHESIEALVENGATPVYVVHFTQKAAATEAQALTSVDLIPKEQKQAIKDATSGVRFDTPYGKDLKRFLHSGVGLHHAGLLPKYRRLVERLAQQGLLKVICGTDTLGVGVNVPIRTVLLTQLCKFDGETTRLLTVREFQQIAGRAGRRGFDTEGSVWVQAPSHVVENKRMLSKAGSDKKAQRKVVRKQPPKRGFVPWTEAQFEKLAEGTPETLRSSFTVGHAMLLQLLDRPGDGCAAVRRLLNDNHDDRPAQRRHIKRAIQIYRSLRDSAIIEILDEPDSLGRLVRLDLDLQTDFALNQPLSPFAIEAIAALDPESPEHALDAVSVVESIMENPNAILFRQVDKLKTQFMSELKAQGVQFEERIRLLDEITWPQPLHEYIYEAFNLFAARHPWVEFERVRPKSIVRDLFEQAMTFNQYVDYYGARASEGVLLRYLSDTYKALVQTIPEDAKTDPIFDVIEWLGAVVRSIDSSLIDEWEAMRHAGVAGDASTADADEGPLDITANKRAFRVMIRNVLFRWVTQLARRSYGELAIALADHEWTATRLEEALAPYWDRHAQIRTDPDARGPDLFIVEESGPIWRVEQILLDPDDDRGWRIVARVDLARSREAGEPVVTLSGIGELGA